MLAGDAAGLVDPFYALVDMLADRIGYAKLLLRVFGSFPRFLLMKKIALENSQTELAYIDQPRFI